MLIRKLFSIFLLLTLVGCELGDYKLPQLPEHQLDGEEHTNENMVHETKTKTVLKSISMTKEQKQDPDKKFNQTTRTVTEGRAIHPFPSQY